MKRGYIIGISISLLLLTLAAGVVLDKNKSGQQREEQTMDVLISLHGNTENKKIYDRYIKEYNQKYPEWPLTPHYVPADTQGLLKLIYAKQAMKNYDIAILGSDQLYTLLDQDFIYPQEEYIMRDYGLAYVNGYLPGAMADGIYDGKIWSLPIIRNASALYYDKKKVDFTSPVTFQGLLEQASGITADSSRIMAPVNELVLSELAYMDSYNRDLRTNRGKFLTVSTPEKVKLAEDVRTAYLDGRIVNYVQNNGSELQSFLTGEIPLMIGSSFYYGRIKEKTDISLGVLPLFLDENTTYPMEGSNIYLMKQTKNSREDVWTCIKNLLEISHQDNDMLYLDHLPVLESQKTAIDRYYEDDSQEYQKFCMQSFYGYSGFGVEQNSKVLLLTESAVNKLLKEDVEVEHVLKNLQEQIDWIIRQER